MRPGSGTRTRPSAATQSRVRTWLLSRSTSASTVTLKKKLRAKKQSRSIWSKKYNAGSDCRSKQCTGAVCTSCSNDVKDGDETGGVDCGGVLCAQWADGKRCSVATDCASDQCTDGVCTSCFNRVVDGDETGVDCGGLGCAARCAIGTPCKGAKDCATGKCGVRSKQCEALTPDDTCTDGAKNNFEADLDCGGKECRGAGYTWADAADCGEDGDCTSGQSDVDCGGANDCIERRGLGATCTTNADCDTGKCDSGTNQCRELTPTDTCADVTLNYM